MSYGLRFHDLAKQDYMREVRWSAEQWGHVHAMQYFERVDGAILGLRRLPHAYPLLAGGQSGLRILRLDGLSIAYHVDDDSRMVTVLALLGSHRRGQEARIVSERAPEGSKSDD